MKLSLIFGTLRDSCFVLFFLNESQNHKQTKTNLSIISNGKIIERKQITLNLIVTRCLILCFFFLFFFELKIQKKKKHRIKIKKKKRRPTKKKGF